MMEYPKIETLFNRDKETFKVNTNEFRFLEFELINKWLLTEKIDGTNIRIVLTPENKILYLGRTDNAQMPSFLFQYLQELIPIDKLLSIRTDPTTSIYLFGEGYGAKIQKGGGNYNPNPAFRLFDIAFEENGRVWWQNWDRVKAIAGLLGIKVVQEWAIPTSTIVTAVKNGLKSSVALEENNCDCLAEGIVARTEPLLFTRTGNRLMWKLKTKDF